MSAPGESSSGNSPSEPTQTEGASKKRTLDEGSVGQPSTSAITAEPELKRRKTSKSPMASPPPADNPMGTAQFEIPATVIQGESSTKTLADDVRDPALGLDNPDDMGRSRKNRSASGGSQGKASDSNTTKKLASLPAANPGENGSALSNAPVTLALTKSKKQMRREVLTLKNQEFKLPTNPTLLDPAFDGEMWESKAARFIFAVSGKNPTAALSLNSLGLIYEKYLKVFAWVSQGKRQQKTQEAKAAFSNLRESGTLDQKINYDEWVFPDKPSLLVPLLPDEGLPSKLERLCAALLKANPGKRVEMTPFILDLLIRRWVSKHSFKKLKNGKLQRQKLTLEIDDLKQRPLYIRLLAQSLSETPNTEEDAMIVEHGVRKVAPDDLEEDEDEQAEDTGHVEGEDEDEEEDKREFGDNDDEEDGGKTEDEDEENEEESEPSRQEDQFSDQEGPEEGAMIVNKKSTMNRPAVIETLSQPLTIGSGPAPTASDWASLLEPATGGGSGNADSDSRTAIEPPIKSSGGAEVLTLFREALGDLSKHQQKYFPSDGSTSPICVVCACPGHSLSGCPSVTCRHCRSCHLSWECPERKRCTKCKQLGHGAASCTEKLALSQAEGLECAFCASPDHLEYECDVVWRSFHILRPQDKKTVRSIPAFCSLCGSEGHFSHDCGLRGDRRLNKTWSLANRDQYVDDTSEQEAISAQSQEPGPAATGPGTQIKGLAAKRTHVFYSDSDGSEEGEFLGGKVQPKAGPGQIRMATNIQFTPNIPSTYLPPPPPLPLGPPPPGPPPRGGGYSSLSQSRGLPPRPVAPGQPTFGLPQPPLPNYPPPPGLGMNGPGQPSNSMKRLNGPPGGGHNTNKRPRHRRGGR